MLYPEVHFTKGEVLNYYTRIAQTMLPHITGRCITLRRWPNGVEGKSFFEKRCPKHRPEWVPVSIGPGNESSRSRSRKKAGGDDSDDSPIAYCRIEEAAALVWTANLAALELHAPMSLAADLDRPTMAVFDLDPGEPATIIECCQRALEMKTVLDALGLQGFAKTSGSKGLQVYVPLNTPVTHGSCADFALGMGHLLMKQNPAAVTVTMAKANRPGKVFVDWSQNSRHKTTVAPYSLRAKPTPTVSTPITWDEVGDCADGEKLSYGAADVLQRIEVHGDLFAPTLTLQQELPG